MVILQLQKECFLIAGINIPLLLFFIPLLFAGCHEEEQPQATVPSTYVLILTDTTKGNQAWLADYRQNRLTTAKVVLSGYPNETQPALLARLPWLLQPGVDTLLLDKSFIGNSSEICDSVAVWSPSTSCKLI